MKIIDDIFLLNPDTHSSTKNRIVLKTPKKLEQTPLLPPFSDVIALAGNSGLPAAFCTLPPHKTGGKKRDQPGPAKEQIQNRLNGLFWKNNPLKQYFLLAWTPLPQKPENWISKLANGACNGLQIDQVSGSARKIPGFEGFSGSLQSLFFTYGYRGKGAYRQNISRRD